MPSRSGKKIRRTARGSWPNVRPKRTLFAFPRMEQESPFAVYSEIRLQKHKEFMNILSLKDVALSLKSGPLFESVGLDMDEHDKIGLIGRNGTGKSSLLRLMAGELSPDFGSIAKSKGFSYSYLPQTVDVPEGMTLGNFLYDGKATEIHALKNSLKAGAAENQHAMLGYVALPPASLENRYRALCKELGFADMDAPMRHFSGGEKKKAALARAFAPHSLMLLLDEPTNHLDVETIEWLEARLQAFDHAFILVTHDRWFLDSVASVIAEIDLHSIRKYPGTYAGYLERKAERMNSLEKSENRRLANLKIELEWLHRGARARATKSGRRKKEIEAMSASILERPALQYTFSSAEIRLGKKVCILKDVGLAFGSSMLFDGFSYEIQPGAKIGVVGPNGSGKTSLLNLIAGAMEPSVGTIERGETIRISFFRQTSENLDGESAIIDFIRDHADHFRLPDGSSIDAEFLLERFGYSRDFQKQKIKTLSGGEVRRLMLVRVLSESPNFLLMDEPTNDLDIDTIERLEEYLADFKGSLIVVSHDRLLVDRLSDELLIFTGAGTIERFHGSYLEWKLKVGENAKNPALDSRLRRPAPELPPSPAAASGSNPKSPKLSFREKKELESLIEEIDMLEIEKAKLETLFQYPDGGQPDLSEATRRYAEIETLISREMERWEELAKRE